MLEMLDIRGNYMDEKSLEEIWYGLHSNISMLCLKFDSKDKVLEPETVAFVNTELEINRKINNDILPKVKSRIKEHKSSTTKLNLSNITTTPDAIMKYVKLQK